MAVCVEGGIIKKINPGIIPTWASQINLFTRPASLRRFLIHASKGMRRLQEVQPNDCFAKHNACLL